MKKLILFLIVSSYTLTSNAQAFQSIFEKGNSTWVLNTWNHSISGQTNCFSDTFIVNQSKDTIINGLKFYPINCRSYFSTQNSCAYLFEDTLNGIMIFRQELGGTIIMDTLMNLNLSLNDTIQLPSNYFGRYIVDSVYYKNNLKHIRSNLIDYIQPTINPFYQIPINYVMIEGVGTNLFGIYPVDNTILLHHYKDTNLFYSPSLDTGLLCDKSIVGNKVYSRENSFMVFPNPAKDELNLDGHYSNLEFIEIRNTSGSIYKNINIIDNVIDVSDLSSGVYFINLIIDGQIVVKRFIKSN